MILMTGMDGTNVNVNSVENLRPSHVESDEFLRLFLPGSEIS
jgi:hypothetical protein